MFISTRLSKVDTNIMKGVGLLMIMLHNYFHIIPPVSGQNEFAFHEKAFYDFLQIVKTNPLDIFRQVFSYLGHYGVTIFIFVSSYGLYSSYKNKEVSYFDFLKKRILKLYPTLLIVVLMLFVFISAYNGSLPETTKIKSLFLKLTLLFNFIPGEALEVDGPLWFFSVIVQLYALFPLLKYIANKYGENSMLIIALLVAISNIFLNPFIVKNDLSVYFLFIGQLPVFCLGIYFAARPRIKIPNEMVLLSFAIFIASNVNFYAWHFSFLSCVIIMLAIFAWVKPPAKNLKNISAFLAYTGSISLSLFAVHGMVRFPFEALAEQYGHPVFTNILALFFLAGSYLFAWFVRVTEAKALQVINK